MQIGYHMHHATTKGRLVLGLGYCDWSTLHKLSVILAMLFAAVHIGLHERWYESLLRHRRFGGRKTTIALSVLFLVTALTGFLPWGIRAAGGGEALRRGFIEVHDKLALVLMVLLAIHVSKRIRWFTHLGRARGPTRGPRASGKS